MLPPNELKKKGFTKAVRGYSMAEVDEHIEFIIEKYTELYRENDELERKLKTTQQKLDTIKKDEESIRSALINAQRASSAIINEANERAEVVMRATKTNCDKILSDFRAEIRAERDNLIKLRAVVSKFKNDLFNLYNTHIEFIENINTEPEGFDDIQITEEALVRQAISNIKKDVAYNIEQIIAKEAAQKKQAEEPDTSPDNIVNGHLMSAAGEDAPAVGPKKPESEDKVISEGTYDNKKSADEIVEEDETGDGSVMYEPEEERNPEQNPPAFIRNPVLSPKANRRGGSVKDNIREINKILHNDDAEDDGNYYTEDEPDGTGVLSQNNDKDDDDFGAEEFEGFAADEIITAQHIPDDSDDKNAESAETEEENSETEEDKEYREFLKSIEEASGGRRNNKKNKKNKPKPLKRNGNEFDFI